MKKAIDTVYVKDRGCSRCVVDKITSGKYWLPCPEEIDLFDR